MVAAITAPPLMITGWYDWGLADALATWERIERDARDPVRAGARLLITPASHGAPGYRDGSDRASLAHSHRLPTHVPLLAEWYRTVAADELAAWPRVIYFVMGANEWRAAEQWPPAGTRPFRLFCHDGQSLRLDAALPATGADAYTYDPRDPTPTVGGSIVSAVIAPGIIDVADVQRRGDVLSYTSPPLRRDLDVVGPLAARLYVESDAPDTDFAVRLSDVHPDGRALQVQSGFLRARHRDVTGEAEPLEPGTVYRLAIDMWATAYRLVAGHRLRIDIASADFPRFDRNGNSLDPGDGPRAARQTIHRSARFPSHVEISVLGELTPDDFEPELESTCD